MDYLSNSLGDSPPFLIRINCATSQQLACRIFPPFCRWISSIVQNFFIIAVYTVLYCTPQIIALFIDTCRSIITEKMWCLTQRNFICIIQNRYGFLQNANHQHIPVHMLDFQHFHFAYPTSVATIPAIFWSMPQLPRNIRQLNEFQTDLDCRFYFS